MSDFILKLQNRNFDSNFNPEQETQTSSCHNKGPLKQRKCFVFRIRVFWLYQHPQPTSCQLRSHDSHLQKNHLTVESNITLLISTELHLQDFQNKTKTEA